MINHEQVSQKWEYTIVHTDRLNTPGGPQLAPIWKRKYADGSTDWDQINKLGEDGWEMVNAFPVENGGSLLYLAFIFKRPKRPASAAQPGDLAAEAASEAEAPAAASPAALTPGDEPPTLPGLAA